MKEVEFASKSKKNTPRTLLKTLLISFASISLLQGCGNGQAQVELPIKIDGSSTVYPITELIVNEFNSQNQAPVDVQVEFSGTVGGFEKFCRGETDINNASVPIPKSAMELCKSNKIPYIELPVGFDALTVVINPNNDFAETMTVEELKTIWEPASQGKITRWNQVNPNWKDQPLNLFGPGKDSGTFEYFTTVIMGEENASRNDYVFSEDDEAIANGVIQDPNALGYFGYAYYQEHQDKLKAVGINNGDGAVLPSVDTVKNSSYQPLSRPLFIYVNAKTAQENPSLAKLVEFYLQKASTAVTQVGYVPLPDSAYQLAKIHFEKNQVGTVFNGSPIVNASINELLTQTYANEDKVGYVY
jgi:phosphate transport system substrate-binding protein